MLNPRQEKNQPNFTLFYAFFLKFLVSFHPCRIIWTETAFIHSVSHCLGMFGPHVLCIFSKGVFCWYIIFYGFSCLHTRIWLEQRLSLMMREEVRYSVSVYQVAMLRYGMLCPVTPCLYLMRCWIASEYRVIVQQLLIK